jgi:hypothetical protein
MINCSYNGRYTNCGRGVAEAEREADDIVAKRAGASGKLNGFSVFGIPVA